MSLRIAFLIPLFLLMLTGWLGLELLGDVAENGVQTGLPARVTGFRGHHRVRYSAHSALALTLDRVRPDVAALQWLRAAAHVGSDRETARVVAGLTSLARRSGGSGGLEATLCPLIAQGLGPSQQEIIRSVPVRCVANG